jgi:hypothetical protein
MNRSRSAATASSGGASLHVFLPDAGEDLDALRYRPEGVYEGRELVDHAFAGELHGADLDDGVGLRVETGGLQVQGYVGCGQGALTAAFKRL